MRTTTTARLAAALAASALALAACGGDDATSPDDPAAPDDAVSAPADPGTTDDPAGGTRPAGEEFAPEERASMVFGLTEAEAQDLALEFGWTVRTGRVDDEQFLLTEDYVIDRMTVEYDTPEDGGDPVATVVTIELDGGPHTFTEPTAG